MPLMTVREAIETRSSVRAWKDEPIPPETLKRVMEAARLAPSARNLQEWRFVVVTDPDLRARLGEAANGQKFVGEAPAVIVGCAETDKRLMHCGQPAYLIDVSIAMDHITLAAVEEGLGTCWVGAFDPDRVRAILGIPSEVEIVELMPIGFPAKSGTSSKRRLDYGEIVRENGW